MPCISIVVPAHNAAAYLAATLAAVRRQTVADWELIVVDDGSTDGTAALARAVAAQDMRVRLVAQENAGVAAARNTGYAHSDPSASYLIFLDADDVWEQDALEALLAALQDRPTAVGAHGKMRFIDEQGAPCRQSELPRHQRRYGIADRRLAILGPGEPTTFAVLVVFCAISTPGQLLIRRPVFDALGPFDSALTPVEDWDMWLRLSRQGTIAFVDAVVLNYRQHGANASLQGPAMRRAEARLRRKLLSSAKLSDEQRALARAGARGARRIRSGVYWTWALDSAARRRWPAAARQLRHALIERVLSFV